MLGITLLYAYEDRVFANEFAEQLAAHGFELNSNHKLSRIAAEQLSAGQILRRGVSLVIPLLSKHFFRDEAKFVQICVNTIQIDRTLIYPISLDDFWYRINSESVDALQGTSYITEPNVGEQHDVKVLRAGIQRHLDRTLTYGIDHQTLNHVQSLLDDGNSSIELIEVDESKETNSAVIRKRDPASQSETYYIYVGAGASLSAVREKLNRECHYALTPSSIVIRAVEQDDLLSVTQIKNAKKIFECDAVSFQTLIQRVTEKKFSVPSNKLASSEIIVPQRLRIYSTKDSSVTWSDTSTDVFLSQFIVNRKTDPRYAFFSLVNGGGAGKTHVASRLHDTLLQNGYRELFFFSGRQVESLKDAGDNNIEISSLYDVYKYALKVRGESKPLSRKHFEVRFVSEESFFFVDGVEEIQGFIGEKFDQKKFFEDCVRLLKKNRKGTIFTTSRTKFWTEEQNSEILEGKLSLFNKADKQKFFNLKFSGNPKKADLALKIEKQISSSENRNIKETQLPLFCSCIYYFVERTDDVQSLEVELQDKKFRGQNGLSLLVEYTVKREGNRAGITWTKDSVSRALQNFSVLSVGGPVSLDDLVAAFESEFSRRVSIKEVLAIKNLIFLERVGNEELFRIRFSFLKVIFQADYFIRQFVSEPLIFLEENRHQRFASNMLAPNSDVTARIKSTFKALMKDNPSVIDSYYESSQLAILGIRDELKIKPDRLRHRLISNLFYLVLEVTDSFSKDKATEKLITFFQEKSSGSVLIRGFCCVDYNNNPQNQPRFDFRGMTLMNCIFDGYDSIWKCTADVKTTITDSSFYNCQGVPSKSSVAIAEYHNLNADQMFRKKKSELLDSFNPRNDNIVQHLVEYFKIFASNGDYKEFKTESVFEKKYSSRTGRTSKKITKALIRAGVIEKRRRDKPLLCILPDQIMHVQAFCDNNTPSRKIETALQNLSS